MNKDLLNGDMLDVGRALQGVKDNTKGALPFSLQRLILCLWYGKPCHLMSFAHPCIMHGGDWVATRYLGFVLLRRQYLQFVTFRQWRSDWCFSRKLVRHESVVFFFLPLNNYPSVNWSENLFCCHLFSLRGWSTSRTVPLAQFLRPVSRRALVPMPLGSDLRQVCPW